jgi:hypothetical protein
MVLISRGFEYGFNAAIAAKGFNQSFPRSNTSNRIGFNPLMPAISGITDLSGGDSRPTQIAKGAEFRRRALAFSSRTLLPFKNRLALRLDSKR